MLQKTSSNGLMGGLEDTQKELEPTFLTSSEANFPPSSSSSFPFGSQLQSYNFMMIGTCVTVCVSKVGNAKSDISTLWSVVPTPRLSPFPLSSSSRQHNGTSS